MFTWFRKKSPIELPVLYADIHSHLLPGIDDGVKTIEDSIEIIRFLKSLGYQKFIITPHVMSDAFRNTPEIILGKLNEVREELLRQNVDVQIFAAAEYYLDEFLYESLLTTELLTLPGNYLLFETNFLTEPLNLKEFIFKATTKGYKLILAHPERYVYLQNDLSKAEDLLNRGVLFQVNITSISGYYSKPAQKTARELIERGWVHWLGTDCHHMQHAKLVEEMKKNKYFQKALNLPLLNFKI